MPDEPTNAELGRRVDFLDRELGNRVSHAVYMADQRTAELRFAEMGAGLADVRSQHAADVAELKRQHTEDLRVLREELAEQAKAGTEQRMHWRSLILTGVLPALVTGLGILVTWLISRGGHLWHEPGHTRRQRRAWQRRSPSPARWP
jgi:hypothetical protein